LEEASGMVVLTSSDTRRRLANPARLLLRRRAMIYPPTPARIGVNPDAAAPVHAGVNPAAAAPVHAGVNPAAGVDLLETDLVDRGWLLGPALRDALVRLDVAELVNVGATLLADCDALLGADRPHVPLFRDFPASTPDDTMAFFVDRILTAWFQTPDQPCVLCDTDDTVAPVNPCGHLVCRACFDGADFSACPICHRRINPDDPFVKPARPRPLRGESAAPERLRVLHLGFDQDADLRAELVGLLARTAALPPADADDLATLLALQPRIDLSWLPARVPGRETKARLLAWLLTDPLPAGALDRAAALVDTATDVLRLLVVRSDGDASLIGRPRLAPVPRPLRRALLGLLDCIGTVRLVDDMRRHRRAWIAVGEKLHPGEYADRYPAVALAFATLRCSDMTTLCPRTAVAGQVAEDVRIDDAGRVTVAVWGHRVESALADGDVATAVSLLAARPGELLRRLDHLLRLAATDEDLAAAFAALTAAAPQVSPAVLLSALGQVRTRTARHRTRVFFPAGRTSTAHVIDDERAVLPSGVVARAVDILQAEALRRAATLRRVDRAVIDTGLDGLVVPFAERTAARALLTLARGSVLPVPHGRYLRLFCHWMQNTDGPRVDLDLSVALYSEAWEHIGTCDYTSLRVAGAVHSGDLTSAPPPLGASEFVDLDINALAVAGVRYAVMVVLSYNNVAFTDMAEAFAGLMLRSAPPKRGEVFDALAVEQRFDLTGPGKVTMPFVVDLAEETMRWMDVTARVTGTNHAVHRHH